MIIENNSEIVRVLESLGIKVRNENCDLRSKEELTAEVLALLENCDKEDGIRLLFALSVNKLKRRFLWQKYFLHPTCISGMKM